MDGRSLIISFALFRKPPVPDTIAASNKYLVGMLANIEAIGKHCPMAEIWIYYDDSIGADWLKLLNLAQQHSGLSIMLKSFDYPDFRQTDQHGHIGLFGTLARYMALADFTDEVKQQSKKQEKVLLVRDADMIFNLEDLKHISQFEKESNKFLHRYVDCRHYPWPIIGGSFAIKTDFLKNAGYTSQAWRERILKFATTEMQNYLSDPFRYFVDQRFLKEIYEEIKPKKGTDIIDTTEVHIPIAGEDLNKHSRHYKLWWCDIADEIPEMDFTKCKDLEKWLCEQSDTVKQWMQLASKAMKHAEEKKTDSSSHLKKEKKKIASFDPDGEARFFPTQSIHNKKRKVIDGIGVKKCVESDKTGLCDKRARL